MIAYQTNSITSSAIDAAPKAQAAVAADIPWVPAPFALEPVAPAEAPITTILRRVSFETGVPVSLLLGPVQSKGPCRARFAVMWLARMALGRSTAQIGLRIKRDHSTIVSGLRRAEQMRERDPAFRMMTDRLLAEFTQGEPA